MEKKEAMKILKDFHDKSALFSVRTALDTIIPELKESEDEKIRKALIDGFTVMKESKNCGKTFSNHNIPVVDILAWLEKQEQEPKKVSIWKHWKNGIAGNGEGKQIYLIKIGNTYNLSSCLSFECDYIELSELDNLMLKKQGEHSDFISKIQVGDKVTRNEDGVLVNLSQLNRVAKIEEPTYTKKDVDDAYLRGLEDAKSTEIKEDPCKDCYAKSLNCQNFPCDRKKAFDEKMFAWSEEDGRMVETIISHLERLKNYHTYTTNIEQCQDWLKSLKDRVQPQPKQEWSEEDEKHIMAIDLAVNRCVGKWHCCGEKCPIFEHISWLKSLSPQNRCAYNPYKAVVDSIAEMCKHYDKANYSGLRDFYDNVKVKCKDAKEYDDMHPNSTLKPSDEQMITLRHVISGCSYDIEPLVGLETKLKEL